MQRDQPHEANQNHFLTSALILKSKNIMFLGRLWNSNQKWAGKQSHAQIQKYF